MTKKPLVLITLLLLFMATGFLSQGFAQMTASDALFGLKAVRVEVKPMENSDERVQEIGLDDVLAQTEAQLSAAGLTLLPEEEYLRLLRSFRYPLALVEVVVGVFPIQESELVIYTAKVRLNQAVYMARRPVIKFLAPTWEARHMGSTKDLPSLKGRIKVMVSNLIEDYQSAGPTQ
jgi:hypothetical protein